jgi:hypothetical protein
VSPVFNALFCVFLDAPVKRIYEKHITSYGDLRADSKVFIVFEGDKR